MGSYLFYQVFWGKLKNLATNIQTTFKKWDPGVYIHVQVLDKALVVRSNQWLHKKAAEGQEKCHRDANVLLPTPNSAPASGLQSTSGTKKV